MSIQDGRGYTCVECLSNPAIIAVEDEECGGLVPMCEACVHRAVEDHMLDRVNDGSLTVDSDGNFHVPEEQS